MKNIDVLNYLNKLYPLETSLSFDNCGFLVGNKHSDTKNVFVCLDITSDIVDEAIQKDVNLIITHHPIIFHPLKNVSSDELVYKLIKNDISVISMHTNLDICDGGVNDVLAELLLIKNVKKFNHSDSEGALIRIGEVSSISTINFIENVKNILNIDTIKANRINKVIKKVAVCGGSGGSFIPLLLKSDVDAYITSEINHDKFILGNENNLLLLDCGHFFTENVVTYRLKSILKNEFKEIIIDIPKNNINPTMYY